MGYIYFFDKKKVKTYFLAIFKQKRDAIIVFIFAFATVLLSVNFMPLSVRENEI